MLIKRAFVVMLVGASMLWVLIGPASLAAAAAGPDFGTYGGTATAPAPDDQYGEPRHGCHHHSDDGGTGSWVCCGQPAPTDAPTPTPEPTPKAAPPTPRPHPATVTTPEKAATPPATSSPAPATPPRTPAGARPPVIAPPALTIPAPDELTAGALGPATIYAIALATVLVAATIAVATLVLVRRSD